MTSSPLDLKPNQLDVRWVEPANQTDPRVPTVPETNIGAVMGLRRLMASRPPGWIDSPVLSITQPRELVFSSAKAVLPQLPMAEVDLSGVSAVLPSLPGGAGLIKKSTHLAIVAMVAEVGAEQDPILGQMTFSYLEGVGQAATLETTTKENARRYSGFWLIIASDNPIDEATFIGLLGTNIDGDRTITIGNTTTAGFAMGGNQAYALDGYWAQGATYKVLTDFVTVLQCCQVQRFQNYASRGFTWGLGGEDPLESDFHLLTEAVVPTNQQGYARRRIMDLMSGTPGPGSSYAITVQNLVAGTVAGVPGREGQAASSPNGAVNLANDQRNLFSNEERSQTYGALRVTASNNGSGLPVVTIGLNTQVPWGTAFDQNESEHKIYTLNGDEQSEFGSFINLGGTGSLTWVGDSNTTITPGQQVYFVPAIKFPAGSGFSIPFTDVTHGWVSGAQISGENIRLGGGGGLDAYEAPANGEDYIAIVAPERAALHYIYKKYSVTTDGNGVLVAPVDANGCIAFIDGVSGRIDTPVHAGLTPNTTYDCLCYYTPKSVESWQFQMTYAEYQGTAEADFVDGAEIVSDPIFYVHTQGGGGSVFRSDGRIRYVPISMHLPSISSGQPAYQMHLPCWLAGEQELGPTRFRQDISFVSGAGMTMPQIGQIISTTVVAGNHQKSLALKLMVGQTPLGFRPPSLANGGLFQAVIAFLIKKGDEYRLLVATHVSTGGVDVPLDSSQMVALDTFR